MRCASCSSPLEARGEEQLRDIVKTHQQQAPVSARYNRRQPSSGRSAVEDSFILLDGAKRDRRSAAVSPTRSLEESYVLLVEAAERSGRSSVAAASQAPTLSNKDILAARLHALELATTATQVDQPLCHSCCRGVEAGIRSEMVKLQQEVDAYEAALEQLQAEPSPEPPAQAAAALKEQEKAERNERAKAEKAEAQLATELRRLDNLKAAADEIAVLERRYWRAVNELDLQLAAHLQDRDTVLAKIHVAEAQLAALKRTNVWNDVFHIWHHGPFAIINGARLGRAPNACVTWDEVNAAWGHAVLILYTLAQVCNLKFRHHRLLPMGSYARVATPRATYNLHGPVNRLACTSYDAAQVGFLACLKEFEEHARDNDRSQGRRTLFELPYTIEGDKVGDLTIKFFFNKEEAWSAALKFMATNLKWALKWVVAEHDKALAASLLPHNTSLLAGGTCGTVT